MHVWVVALLLLLPATAFAQGTLYPHSVGFTCGPGSTATSTMKTFPVAP